MTNFALDTNTIGYFMRGEGRVAQHWAATAPSDLALPAVVAYEIRFGLQRAARHVQMQAFDKMLEVVAVLNFDAEAAAHAADIRSALELAGTPIGPHDVLIAATARRYGRVLVTHNTREFVRVPGLLLQDWY